MATRFRESPAGAVRIPLPDTRQDTDYSCGASSLLTIYLYYGVGPVEERLVVRDFGMSDRGANPEHLVRAARKYGLRTKETLPVTVDELRETVDGGWPVVCMVQAWGGRKRYADVWDSGHWVVAIGRDDGGVYFEDPSIVEARGYLTYAELEDRWHDVGKYNKHVPRYGVIACLLTTQRRSGPGSPVARFIATSPFLLRHELCHGQPELDLFVTKVLSEFRGLRRSTTTGREVNANAIFLDGGWEATAEVLERVRLNPSPDIVRPRIAAD